MKKIMYATIVVFLLNACGGGSSDGTEVGKTDTSKTDAGGTDTGGTDAGGTDAGGTDAGGTDTGGTDAGGTDAGGTDAGGTDTGGTDTGGTDTGGTDTGGTDTGGTDTGGTDPVDINYSTGVTLIYKTLTYKEVKSPKSNRIWLDRNIGATRVCQENVKESDYVASPGPLTSHYFMYELTERNCFGAYFQWGRDADGHELANTSTAGGSTTLTPNTNVAYQSIIQMNPGWYAEGDWAVHLISSVNEFKDGTQRASNWADTDGTTNGVCPAGYRVPLPSEFGAELTAQLGTPFDLQSNFLRLPASGYKNDGTLAINTGVNAFYWSSSASGTPTERYKSIAFVIEKMLHPITGLQEYAGTNGKKLLRRYSLPVRCIKPVPAP
ncbi:MAG: FISUMP domain-containing protein [Sulfurovum sp.]